MGKDKDPRLKSCGIWVGTVSLTRDFITGWWKGLDGNRRAFVNGVIVCFKYDMCIGTTIPETVYRRPTQTVGRPMLKFRCNLCNVSKTFKILNKLAPDSFYLHATLAELQLCVFAFEVNARRNHAFLQT